MHLDLHQAEADVSRKAEVCIIGAGAAGIIAASRLIELGHSVLMLESGGLDYEPEIAALNAGDNVGEPYYDLRDARLRFFGGATAIWGGRLAQLDRIDLVRRPWVPHSGWPISWSDLEPWYAPARTRFGLPDEPGGWPDLPTEALGAPAFDPARLEIGLWAFDRKFNRFTFGACADLVRHPRCTVVTHATVTEIVLDPSGSGVRRVRAASLAGRTLSVEARAFLLAAGGIENPRLLLASRSVAPAGIGNAYDQVGRYFMEHPHARGGAVVGPGVWSLLRVFGRSHRLGGREVAALVKPSQALQAERGILNSSITIAARQAAGARQFWGMRTYERIKHQVAPTRDGRRLWMASKKAALWAQRRIDPLRPWLLHKLGVRDVALVVRAEQSPNPESRVRLTGQADPLGVPRAALDWRLARLDVSSVSVLVEALDRELRRLGLGQVRPAAWLGDPAGGWRTDPLISVHPIGGYHHMGATRMSASPREGVVDGFGRVHGLGNLYVVGSSVFTTSGWANPTLTIAALCLRTSERLSRELSTLAAQAS